MLSDKVLASLCMFYNKKYDLELPRRTCFTYRQLELIEDYEYTYRISFEMLKRTKSFKKLFDIKIEDRGEEWASKAKTLGLDTYKIKKEYRPSSDCLLYEALDSFTISDVDDGIAKLIDYYYAKNKIYTINEKSLPQHTYDEEVDDHEVYINSELYSIPSKDVNSQDDIIIMQPIGKHLELKELEDDFLSTITLKDIIDFNGKINHFWKKRPLIADLDDDDNLSRLIDFYIKNNKIYKDEKGKDEVKSPNSLEILSNCSNFYIPCRVKKNNKIDIEYKQISPIIPLDEINELNVPLEDKFSANIKLSELGCLVDKRGHALTIKDIQKGFNKLINYYADKKKISPNELSRATKKYKHCDVKKYFKDKKDIAISRILFVENETYYIPCKKNIYSSKNEVALKKISKSLSLKILEDCFVKTINKSDITNKELKIIPAYKIPALKFHESTIINLPVNVNLPEKELVAYIKKIKKDYDTKNTNLKHPLELIGEKLIRAEKPKSIAELETSEKKKNIADIFYIHDVQEIFLEQKEKIKSEREEEISKLKQAYTDPIEVQKAIDDSSHDYEKEIVKYDNENILKEIRKLKNFSKNKITLANTYINHYIKKEKYKELITAIGSKEY